MLLCRCCGKTDLFFASFFDDAGLCCGDSATGEVVDVTSCGLLFGTGVVATAPAFRNVGDMGTAVALAGFINWS